MASAIELEIRKVISSGIGAVHKISRSLKAPPAGDHPYLSGVHAPIGGEFSLSDLKVTGEIPAELDGLYFRNGPNPVRPMPAGYHWFTGDGMLHGVRIGGGRALWYKNRWVRTTDVSKALGEPIAPGPRGASADTVNTNVVGFAGKIWAISEAGALPVEMDQDLTTVAHNPFEGTLKGSFTAHPHLDPDTGEFHAICYDATNATTIRHVVVSADGRVRREEPITVEHGPSIHDCMITRRFVIVLDLPVTLSMAEFLGGNTFPYKWNPQHRARIGLLPREGKASDIIWCDIAPCYIFHPVNAYERADGRVVFDSCVHGSMFAESTLGPDSKTLQLERWVIDPQSRKVERTVLDPTPQEFPRADERLTGKPYRYAYAMAAEISQTLDSDSRLFKHDFETGQREVHEFGPGRHPGEFVFVPKSDAAGEDDGWLIGFVVDLPAQTTDLVILDARNFTGPPRASVHIPHRIPSGFHGNWIPAHTLAAGR